MPHDYATEVKSFVDFFLEWGKPYKTNEEKFELNRAYYKRYGTGKNSSTTSNLARFHKLILRKTCPKLLQNDEEYSRRFGNVLDIFSNAANGEDAQKRQKQTEDRLFKEKQNKQQNIKCNTHERTFPPSPMNNIKTILKNSQQSSRPKQESRTSKQINTKIASQSENRVVKKAISRQATGVTKAKPVVSALSEAKMQTFMDQQKVIMAKNYEELLDHQEKLEEIIKNQRNDLEELKRMIGTLTAGLLQRSMPPAQSIEVPTSSTPQNILVTAPNIFKKNIKQEIQID